MFRCLFLLPFVLVFAKQVSFSDLTFTVPDDVSIRESHNCLEISRSNKKIRMYEENNPTSHYEYLYVAVADEWDVMCDWIEDHPFDFSHYLRAIDRSRVAYPFGECMTSRCRWNEPVFTDTIFYPISINKTCIFHCLSDEYPLRDSFIVDILFSLKKQPSDEKSAVHVNKGGANLQ